MELLFGDPHYDCDAWEARHYRDELIKSLGTVDPTIQAIETDVGRGADGPAILVHLFTSVDWSSLVGPAAIVGLFFQGKRIDENLSSWIEIYKKLREVFDRAKPYRIDEKAAVILFLEKLDTEGVNLDGVQFGVQVIVLAPGLCAKGELDSRPDALYFVTARTRDAVRLALFKSSGELLYEKVAPTNWHDFPAV